MTDSQLRVAVVSQRRRYDQVGFTGAYEFEDLIVNELTNGVLLEPEGNSVARPINKAKRVARSRLAQMGVANTTRSGTGDDDGDYEFDLMFLAVRNPFEIDVLDSMARWRKRAEKVVCLVVELWPPHLEDWKLALQGFDQFDHVFLGLANGVDEFGRIVGVPTSYLPPAVDTLLFHPGNPAPARSIDVANFGRISEAAHHSLKDFAAQHGAYYHFSTLKDPRFVDPARHREQHAALLHRSMFSIANYAKFDRPDETGGAREIGYRFFECAAAGSIMIGQSPKTEEWNELFGYPGDVIEAEIDGAGIAALLNDLRAQPELLESYRRAGIENALRQNDWSHRWRDVLVTLGLPTNGVEGRVARMNALADHEDQQRVS